MTPTEPIRVISPAQKLHTLAAAAIALGCGSHLGPFAAEYHTDPATAASIDPKPDAARFGEATAEQKTAGPRRKGKGTRRSRRK